MGETVYGCVFICLIGCARGAINFCFICISGIGKDGSACLVKDIAGAQIIRCAVRTYAVYVVAARATHRGLSISVAKRDSLPHYVIFLLCIARSSCACCSFEHSFYQMPTCSVCKASLIKRYLICNRKQICNIVVLQNNPCHNPLIRYLRFIRLVGYVRKHHASCSRLLLRLFAFLISERIIRKKIRNRILTCKHFAHRKCHAISCDRRTNLR